MPATRPPIAWLTLLAMLAGLAGMTMGGCSSAPKVVVPPLLEQALSIESDAARRYQRGELEAASRGFAEAVRAFVAIDDGAGIARNRHHLARVHLARGKPAAALQQLVDPADTSLDADLIRAQALLGLQRHDEAETKLRKRLPECTEACRHGPALQLLLARLALATSHPDQAVRHAQLALTLLAKDATLDDGREQANAYRLLAQAMLAGGAVEQAEIAAQQALTLDRQLALPEKLARDWLLLGEIRQQIALRQTPPSSLVAARAAYRQAQEIATAAGLSELRTAAEAALMRLPVP